MGTLQARNPISVISRQLKNASELLEPTLGNVGSKTFKKVRLIVWKIELFKHLI